MEKIVLLAAIALLLVFVLKSVVVVKAYEKRVLTVFGSQKKILDGGFTIIPPFVSRTHSFDMRPQSIDIPSQDSITLDNEAVRMYDFSADIKIKDVEKCFKNTEDFKYEVSNRIQESLRRVAGDMKSENIDSEVIAEQVERDISYDIEKEIGVTVSNISPGSANVVK
jgi:regulator of protease activity HflC (stomatin/prohibitin superfamily)